MNDRGTQKPFDQPVRIRFADTVHEIGSVEDAAGLLSRADWPGRGPRRRDAYETCLKVLDGHRMSENARRELVEAAREAGLPVED